MELVFKAPLTKFNDFYLHLLSSSQRSCCANVLVVVLLVLLVLVPTYLILSFRAHRSIEGGRFESSSEKQSLRTQ